MRSLLKFVLLFSLPLPLCGPVAHTNQKDMSCVQTACHSEQPRALRVRVRRGKWRTRAGGRSREGFWAHSAASTVQPGISFRYSRHLFRHHKHHSCSVPHFPSTLRLAHPGWWTLLLPRGGNRLWEWRCRRGQATHWWRHCSAHH